MDALVSKEVRATGVFAGKETTELVILMALSLLHTYILLTPTATLSKSWYLS